MIDRRPSGVHWASCGVLVACLAVPVAIFAQATPKLPPELPVPKTGAPTAEPAPAARAPVEPATPSEARPGGERDPFEPLVQPGEGEGGIKFTSLKLVGILWDARDRKRIRALVETPDGLGYYLRLNEERFGAKVVGIEPDGLTFSVTEAGPGGGSRVRTVPLKLRSE